MDAYDIFKKLSAGATFSKKKPDGPFKSLKPEPRIKIESEDESDTGVPPPVKRCKVEAQDDDDFYYLSDLHTSHEGNQKKKKKSKKKLGELKQEEERIKVNQLRKSHNISVIGKNVPAPIQSFEELDKYEISETILKNIRDCGYERPTPIQMQAIPVMAKEQHVLACAPTGSGKTAAFLVPILGYLKAACRKGFRALIVSPTRELAQQTFRECARLTEGTSLRTHLIRKATLSKVTPSFAKKFDIIITTPNRLIYLMNEETGPGLSLGSVEWLVVDECDKLFEVGKTGFRDQLAQIYTACDIDKLKCAMFSATYVDTLARWTRKHLKGIVSIHIGKRNTTAEDVDQELIYVGNESGKLIAFRELVHQGLTPPVLVFVQSKDRAKELFNELIYDGINVDVIHSDRTQLQRENVVRAFREGKLWVLICTELMGRGIDFKGVKLVINYDFPPSTISYIHRIGRTGRAGRTGKAITYFTEDDKQFLRANGRSLREAGCPVPDYVLTFKKLKRSEKKALESKAPKRKPIATSKISYEKYKKNKLERMKEASKRRKDKSNSQQHSES